MNGKVYLFVPQVISKAQPINLKTYTSCMPRMPVLVCISLIFKFNIF